MSVVESLIHNGRLRVASVALATALATGACSADAQKPVPTQTPDVTPNGVITPTPEASTQPTHVVIETPKPTETPLSMEQQAANTVFDYWFSLLDKTQKVDGNPNVYYLNTSIKNRSDWQHNLDIVKHGGTSDSPLVVDWIGGRLDYSNTYSTTEARADKTQGEAVLTNIKVSPDKKDATGAYLSTLSFDFSIQQNEYLPNSDTPYAPTQTVENWLLTPDNTNPYLPPIQSSQESGSLTAVFKDGQWEMTNKNAFVFGDSGGPLAYIPKPILAMADPSNCQTTDLTSCRIINVPVIK